MDLVEHSAFPWQDSKVDMKWLVRVIEVRRIEDP